MTNMSVYIGSNSTSVQANTLVAVSGTSWRDSVCTRLAVWGCE